MYEIFSSFYSKDIKNSLCNFCNITTIIIFKNRISKVLISSDFKKGTRSETLTSLKSTKYTVVSRSRDLNKAKFNAIL